MNFGLENHYSAETHQKSFRSQSKAVPVRADVEKRAKKERKKFEIWVFEEGRGSMMYVVS